MEGKRLDLDAPLISVRRITASSAPSKYAKLPSQRAVLPSGNSENSGAVPFIWEKRPGHPKDNSGYVAGAVVGGITATSNLSPGRILINASQTKSDHVRSRTPITSSSGCGTHKLITGGVGLNPVDYGEECDAVSDARETLSCNESYSMKSGVTGLSARSSFRDSTSQFSKDLLVEVYMMGRLLPAAQAMACGSPQRSWKKPPRAPVVDKNIERKTVPRRRLPLQYHLCVTASHDNGRKEGEEEDEEELEESDETVCYERKGNFYSKARGLISRFGLKSLLNPVLGMKVRDLPPTKPHRSTLRIKISNDEGIVEDSWEAVYMHRLRNVNFDSKLSTESNQLTHWMDSQTPDGSSSFPHSSVDALSPNKHEDVKNKLKNSKTGGFDSGKEDIGTYLEMASDISKLQASGSTSSATDRTHTNSSKFPDTSNSNSNSNSYMSAGAKEHKDSCFTLLSEFQKTEGSLVAETFGGHELQSGSSSYSKALNCETKKGNDFKNSQKNDVGFELNADCQEKIMDNSLALFLRPPLPKPPSESWLQRTLPNISAKGPYQQSFLGIHFHPMNQSSQASRGGQKLVRPEKPSKMHSYHTTFTGVSKLAC